MIHRISLGRKLAILLGLPLIGLLLMIGAMMSDHYGEYAQMQEVAAEARPALAIAALGRQILKERVETYLQLYAGAPPIGRRSWRHSAR